MTPERIKQAIAEHLAVSLTRVTPEATFEDLGADSLDRVELAILLEEEAGIELPDDVLDRVDTVGQLLSAVRERLQ